MAAGRQVDRDPEADRGRAFVLFTSYATLRAVQAIAEMALDYPDARPGHGAANPAAQAVPRDAARVLFATSSFWQGVDVVGEALSCVIVDKLPFASPGDPITSAARSTRSGRAAASRSTSIRCRWPS